MILLTIIVFILVFGLIVFAHELGHYISARRAGMRVLEFGFGFPPRIYGKKIKGTIYSINLIPIGGFVKILGEEGERKDKKDSFASRGKWERFKVIASGVLFNFILAIVAFSIYFWMGGPTIISPPTSYTSLEATTSEVMVWDTEEGLAAENAGIKRGDAILEINGKKMERFTDVESEIGDRAGEEASLLIRSNGEEKEISLTLSEKDGRGVIGIRGFDNYKSAKYPWWKVPYIAVVESLKLIWAIIVILFIFIRDAIVESKAPEDIAGPVGIFIITKEMVRLGLKEIIRFIGILSINLGIINFLPFPALDGGRALFIGIEAIRGKKVTPKIENAVHTAGFALLIVLLVLITYQDVLKFIVNR